MPEPAAVCVVCKAPLGEGAIRVRYEGRAYAFDRLACKMTFAENPDRWLDANGEVLFEPR